MFQQRRAVLAVLFCACVAAAQPKLRLTAGYSHVPPLHYPDLTDTAAGFAVEVITEAARRENIEIIWKRVGGSNDIERALADRRIDIFPAAVVTESRRRQFQLSEPWWSEDLSILTLAKTTGFPENWQGRRIVLGTPAYAEIAAQLLPGAAVIPQPDYDSRGGPGTASSMVCEGKADAVLLAHSEVDTVLTARPPSCRDTEFRLADLKASLPLALMSRNDAAALMDRLRSRVDELARDGTLAAIADRYPRIPVRSAVALAEMLRLRYKGRLLWAGLAGAVVLTLVISLLLLRQLIIKRALDRALADRAVSLAQLQATFEGMVEPALLAKSNGDVIAINSAYLTVFDFDTPPKTRAELVSQMDLTNPDGSSLDMSESPFSRAVRGEVVRSKELKGRNRKTGKVCHFLTGAAPVRNSTGNIKAVIITAHDITEKKRIEEQLRQSSKMEAIGRLAGGIAHDLNNVLQVIVSYAHLMQEPDTDHGEAVQEIIQASDRAADMTGRLLAFSRQQVMKPKLVGVDGHIQAQTNFIRRLLTDAVQLELRLSAGAARILIDPAHFDQVLVNLAANARQAMPDGGRLVIETSVADTDTRSHPTLRNGSYVTICVADTGLGMTDVVRARIFEPFFSTKKEQGGTGLGLATVYGIIRQSGGDIFVYSEPGNGSSFHIYLPEATGEVEQRKTEALAPPLTSGQERIVVVDDDPQIVRLIERSLRQAKYDVWATSDATAAMEHVRKHTGRVDVLVTDVLMPAMNGRRLAEAIKELDPRIKVLFMSGFLVKSSRVFCLRMSTFFRSPSPSPSWWSRFGLR